MGKPKRCVQCGSELTRGLKDFARSLATMRDDAVAEARAMVEKDTISRAEERRRDKELRAVQLQARVDALLEIRSLSLAAEMEGRCERCAGQVGLSQSIEKSRKKEAPTNA